MIVTNLITIGKVTILSSWIALVFSFIITYGIVRFKFGKRIAEVLLDAIFYFILIWKLSVIITDFKIVIQWPLALLYFNGGRVGFYLGLLGAIIVVFRAINKKKLHRNEQLDLLIGVIIIQAAYQILVALLNNNPFYIEVLTIGLFGVFIVLVLAIQNQMLEHPIQLALLFMAFHMFVAAFQPKGLLDTSVIATWLLGSAFIILHTRESQRKTEVEETF